MIGLLLPGFARSLVSQTLGATAYIGSFRASVGEVKLVVKQQESTTLLLLFV